MPKRPDITDALRQRLLSASHLGLVQPGMRLPSVRELAREFEVEVRTVLAAYRTLEREGLVRLRARSGIYFESPSTGLGENGLTRQEQWAVDVLLAGLARGTPIPEVPAELLRHCAARRLRVACVECNDDQIAALTAELSTDFGFHASGMNVDVMLNNRVAADDLREVDLVVTSPFHGSEVQQLAERAGVPWIAISYRADVFAEIARLLPTMHVYFVLTDKRFAAKLGKIYADADGAHRLHIVRQGHDDVDAIPGDAPTYISRTARERLEGHPLLSRVSPESRILSAASAREILSFVVRANGGRSV